LFCGIDGKYRDPEEMEIMWQKAAGQAVDLFAMWALHPVEVLIFSPKRPYAKKKYQNLNIFNNLRI
jgi:predicted nicotinamide N-methyase